MRKLKITGTIIAVLIIIFILMGPFYILEEGELSIVLRFGKIVDKQQDAGLKFKLPFVDKVTKYSKKLQAWDGSPQVIPTKEKQFIFVDTTARWKISNPDLFYQKANTFERAQKLLDDIINSNVYKIITKNYLKEAVRNSQTFIKDEIVYDNETLSKEELIKKKAEKDRNDAINSDFKGREYLSSQMLVNSKKEISEYGIELIDVVIRQIKYSKELTESVHQRMIRERRQKAQLYRSQGQGEMNKILGKMERELREIRSEATKIAKEIKAEADAKSLEIRNKAYAKDKAFADFWMAIKQYEKLLPKMRKTFTTDADFFKYLYNKNGK
jgi:membrane protease subunit HflC